MLRHLVAAEPFVVLRIEVLADAELRLAGGLMEDFEAAWRLINEWGDNKDRRIHDNSNSQ